MEKNRPQDFSLNSGPDPLRENLQEAWATNNRIHLYLIDQLSEAGLRATTSTRGGRDVARQFVHIHNNRINWLTYHASGFEKTLIMFESKHSPDKPELRTALEASAQALGNFLAQALQSGAKIKGWKHGIFSAFAYHIAHESHRRGNILLTLKLTRNKLDQDAQYKIWDWSHL